MNELGTVARLRFEDARAAKRPEAELLRHLNAAAGFYHEALELLPDNAVDDLAVAHNQLGATYGDAGDLDRALPHYRQGIRYFESAGDRFNAGRTRFNVALHLALAGRFGDAREYAAAALRDFEPFGDRAADETERARRLLADIEEARGKQQGK